MRLSKRLRKVLVALACIAPTVMSQQPATQSTALNGPTLAEGNTQQNAAAPAQSLQLQPSRRRVPDASLPCTPDEAAWWSKLQTAGQAVYRTKGGKEEVKAFSGLLEEGRNNSYRPPIGDQKPVVLQMWEPQYSDEARQRRLSGDIELKVEFRADGTVGEIELINRLGYGLDENAESAARKTVFLPAVKDRNFINHTAQMHMTFSTY